VLERTREIGILKALGASPAFVLGILFRETLLLAILGSALGIGFSYGTRWLIMTLVPASLEQIIVYGWWPIAGAIALVGRCWARPTRAGGRPGRIPSRR